MTTRILTGAYDAGYSLSPAYSALTLKSSAYLGGFGLVVDSAATVTNAAIIHAADGAPGNHAGSEAAYFNSAALVTNSGSMIGGAGGDGVPNTQSVGGAGGNSLYARGGAIASDVVNTGVLRAGAGGAGSGTSGGPALNGGTGGAGIDIGKYASVSGTVVNRGGIYGGAGGAGGAGQNSRTTPGIGGGGGNALVIGTSADVSNVGGTIVGGAGGAGGYGVGIYGGGGGLGGAGVLIKAGGAFTLNSGLVEGGVGGATGGDSTGVRGSSASRGGVGGWLTGGADLTVAGGNLAGGRGGGGVHGGGGGGGNGASLDGGVDQVTGGTISGGTGGAGDGPGFGGYGGDGVFLQSGVLDQSGGAIFGGAGGVGGAGSATLRAGNGGEAGIGVLLWGGSLDQASGAIYGGAGGAAGHGPGPGYGPAAAGGTGLYVLDHGAATTNGLVRGGVGGLSYAVRGGVGGAGATLTGGSLTNTGSIFGGAGGAGPTGYGHDGAGLVVYYDGGSLTNGSASVHTSLIVGQIGVQEVRDRYGYATVTNFATIQGLDGTSVDFSRAGDLLVVEAGAVFIGAVVGGGGFLELAGGAGTISGLGASGTLSGAAAMSFSGFGFYDIGAGAAWTLAGTNALANGQTLVDAGTLTLVGALTNSGAMTGHGVTLSAGGTLTNYGTIKATSGDAVTLTSSNAMLIAESGSTCVGMVQGGGGRLQLAGGTGTITDLGGAGAISGAVAMTFTGFGRYALDTGGSWSLSGANTLSSGQSLFNNARLTGSGTFANGGEVINGRTGILVPAGETFEIDDGAGRIDNRGLIEASAGGDLFIEGGAMRNTGTLAARGGTLTVDCAVVGIGSAQVDGGTLAFGADFSERVAFSGGAGELRLADATAYARAITGFSATGGTSLDLRDIGFVGSGEATFQGAAKGGVLTVTDGTNTARIRLVGNYTAAAFTAASDGDGGTMIVATAAARPPYPFVEAMAGFGAVAASPARPMAAASPLVSLLAKP